MKKINRRRLVREILLLGAIIIAILLACLVPWLLRQPTISDPYAEYKKLYNEVVRYDFSKGTKPDLAERIRQKLNPERRPGSEVYFNYLALANYYLGLGLHNTALVSLESSLPYAPDRDTYATTVLQMVELAHTIGDLDKETTYQRLLDRI